MIVIVIETHFDLWINELDNEMQTQQFLEINARTSKAESRERERERMRESSNWSALFHLLIGITIDFGHVHIAGYFLQMFIDQSDHFLQPYILRHLCIAAIARLQH